MLNTLVVPEFNEGLNAALWALLGLVRQAYYKLLAQGVYFRCTQIKKPRLMARFIPTSWALLGLVRQAHYQLLAQGFYFRCTQIKKPRLMARFIPTSWALLGSNQRPPDYESGALTN